MWNASSSIGGVRGRMDTNCCTEATAATPIPHATRPSIAIRTAATTRPARALHDVLHARPTLVDLTVCREPLQTECGLSCAGLPQCARCSACVSRLVAASPATAPRTATASSSTSVVPIASPVEHMPRNARLCIRAARRTTAIGSIASATLARRAVRRATTGRASMRDRPGSSRSRPAPSRSR